MENVTSPPSPTINNYFPLFSWGLNSESHKNYFVRDGCRAIHYRITIYLSVPYRYKRAFASTMAHRWACSPWAKMKSLLTKQIPIQGNKTFLNPIASLEDDFRAGPRYFALFYRHDAEILKKKQNYKMKIFLSLWKGVKIHGLNVSQNLWFFMSSSLGQSPTFVVPKILNTSEHPQNEGSCVHPFLEFYTNIWNFCQTQSSRRSTSGARFPKGNV